MASVDTLSPAFAAYTAEELGPEGASAMDLLVATVTTVVRGAAGDGCRLVPGGLCNCLNLNLTSPCVALARTLPPRPCLHNSCKTSAW